MWIRFRCGHGSKVDPDKHPNPVCPRCGERKIARALAGNPQFVGHVSGPHANTKYLGARAVSLAEKPLTLKDADA